jgi:hypothetical protein
MLVRSFRLNNRVGAGKAVSGAGIVTAVVKRKIISVPLGKYISGFAEGAMIDFTAQAGAPIVGSISNKGTV